MKDTLLNKSSEALSNMRDEVAQNASKIAKGLQVLNEIDEVDVATAPKKVVWSSDKVKLYHYENPNKITCKIPLLISYALVNRFDMMDLQPDKSFIRKLLQEGIDIYLIDWGYPTKVDRYLTMEDYINGYLDDAVDYIRRANQLDKINLLGVCQGGTFSLIYTALHNEKINTLTTLVTPVDFSVEDGLLFKWSRYLDIDAVVDGYDGLVPGEFLNLGFDMLKPLGKIRKLAGLADTMQDKDKLMNFLRMEKWINDSPAQAGECYRQFIKNMYQQNKLIKGEFKLDGKVVSLKNITVPLLNIYAEQDHLVPPSATIPLNDQVGSTDKQLLKFSGGHIGVFVGKKSQEVLAPTVSNWLKERSNK
jgi:polyhydroxyalkanoate synthase